MHTAHPAHRADPEKQPLAPTPSPEEPDPFWPRRGGLSIRDYFYFLSIAPVILLLCLYALVFSYRPLRWLLQMRCLEGSRRYTRDPRYQRVAVIGAGWTGVQLAVRLRELGVSVVLFEAEDNFGGTWHPKKRYHGLHLHTPAWGAEFAGYPFADGDRAVRDQNPTASAVHEYICSFAESHGLRQVTRFGCKAVRVAHDTATEQAKVTVEHAGKRFEDGPFDMVVFTGFASVPHKPTLPGEAQFVAAGGVSMHAAEMRTATIHSLANDARRLVVVGGGKSACDQIDGLTQAGLTEDGRVTWLYRRPYQFLKTELAFTDRTWRAAVRGALTFFGFFMAKHDPVSAWHHLMRLDATFSYDESAHDPPDGDLKAHASREWLNFRMGLLTERQRRLLRRHTPKRRGEPIGFDERGLRLADGTHVDAQVVVWATGYSTGVEDLEFAIDGVAIPFDALRDRPLFQHCVPPLFPSIAIANHLFTTNGPLRAHTLADYIVHHLCVRGPLPEDVMEAVAAAQVAKPSLDKGIVFELGYLQALPTIWWDLCEEYVVSRADDGELHVKKSLSHSSSLNIASCTGLVPEGEYVIQSVLDTPHWLYYVTRAVIWGEQDVPMVLSLLPKDAAAGPARRHGSEAGDSKRAKTGAAEFV